MYNISDGRYQDLFFIISDDIDVITASFNDFCYSSQQFAMHSKDGKADNLIIREFSVSQRGQHFRGDVDGGISVVSGLFNCADIAKRDQDMIFTVDY